MNKYLVLHLLYNDDRLKTSIFTAKDDIEAVLVIDEHYGYGYYDEDDNSYDDEDFIRPSLEEALKHVAMHNGDGADFIFKIENITTGSVLFKDQCIEEEEDW